MLLIFNNKFYCYEGEGVDIQNALGTKFSYTELMRGI